MLFLDLDGVLATNKEFFMNAANFQRKYDWAKELNVNYPFNKGCVDIFNELVELSDLEVVLSSDWKDHYTLDQMDTIFLENGIKKSPTYKTGNRVNTNSPNDLEINRYFQIMDFVNEHNPDNWLVLDDLKLSPFFEKDGNGDKFFLTKSSEGLKQSGLKDKLLLKLR
jgi:hypothetical protein